MLRGDIFIMAHKIRLSLSQRLKAINLLGQGIKINEVAEQLYKQYHPELDFEIVKRAYFPYSGHFALEQLERAYNFYNTKEFEELAKQKISIMRAQYNQKISSERLETLVGQSMSSETKEEISVKMKDYRKQYPEMNVRQSIEAVNYYEKNPDEKKKRSDRLRGLWKDPKYRKDMAEMSKEIWKDPKYRTQQRNLKSFWNFLRKNYLPRIKDIGDFKLGENYKFKLIEGIIEGKINKSDLSIYYNLLIKGKLVHEDILFLCYIKEILREKCIKQKNYLQFQYFEDYCLFLTGGEKDLAEKVSKGVLNEVPELLRTKLNKGNLGLATKLVYAKVMSDIIYYEPK